jgi:quercetin dioxygenase-like cupin family protein
MTDFFIGSILDHFVQDRSRQTDVFSLFYRQDKKHLKEHRMMIEQIEQGKIVIAGKEISVSELKWNEHASNKGVFLKHLLTSASTEGRFSCHLVKIQAGCEIAAHVHPHNWELHEVISGEGSGSLGGYPVTYIPGTTVLIPEGEDHRVVAEGQDLYLLAKFMPALL